MRKLVPLALLALAACGVDTDPRNDRVTIEYNDQRIENATDAAANEVGRVTSDIANSIEGTGQRIENEVENVDIDVDVRRDGNRNSN